MRALGAKGSIGIGLAVLLVIVSVGGWLLLRNNGDEHEPIVVGVTDRAETVDPASGYSAGSWNLFGNVFQGLLTLTEGSDAPVPDAAESCEFTDNAFQVYRCTVRTGLTFTSGREITAEDVKFSFDRIQAVAQRAEAANEAYAGPVSLMSGVEAVRTDGRDVIFELSEPDVTFPYILAGGAGSIVDREDYEMDQPREGAVTGSGPYKLTDFKAVDDETGEPGYAVLEPNTGYQGAAEVSKYPVTIRYYADAAALQEAWQAREIQVNAGKMSAEDVVAVDRHDLDIRFQETTGASVRMLVNNAAGDSPMADTAVRQAVATLMDREALARTVKLNTVEAAYSLIPVGLGGHGTPYFDRYDRLELEDVRQELADAGYTFPIQLTTGYKGEDNASEAEFIKELLEADGLFTVEVRSFSSFGDLFGAFGNSELDSYYVGWFPDYPDPDTYTSSLLTDTSVLAHGYSNTDVDELIKETKGQPQRASATDAFRRIHELAAEDAVVIPLWQERQFTVSDREITGLQYLRDNSGSLRLWQLSRF